MSIVWGIGASLTLTIASCVLAAGSTSTLVAVDSGIGADPRALSGNGAIVGGSSFNGIVQTGTVWSGASFATREVVGSFSVGLSSIVTGLSSDGSVATGWTNIAQSDTRGFVRTADGRLLTIEGTAGALNPYRVSGNGGTVVGYYRPGTPSSLPARWQEATGMQVLAGLASRTGLSRAVSYDGSKVAGDLRSVSGGSNEAFFWDQVAGAVVLPKFGASYPNSEAWDMSAGGQTIVGSSQQPRFGNYPEAVRWTQSGSGWTLHGLGYLSGSTFSFSTAVSGDGSLIGGASGGGPEGETGFLWTQGSGLVTVNQYAALYGLDLSGWRFQRVEDISADGSTICAKGILNNVVYGVVITVPSTTSAAPLAMAGLSLARRRRR